MAVSLHAAADEADRGAAGPRQEGGRECRHGRGADHSEAVPVEHGDGHAGLEIAQDDQAVDVGETSSRVLGDDTDPLGGRVGQLGRGGAERLEEVPRSDRHRELRLHARAPVGMDPERPLERLTGHRRGKVERCDVRAGEKEDVVRGRAHGRARAGASNSRAILSDTSMLPAKRAIENGASGVRVPPSTISSASTAPTPGPS